MQPVPDPRHIVQWLTAMTNNIRLLRTTLCLNRWIMNRVALYGTGLGTK